MSSRIDVLDSAAALSMPEMIGDLAAPGCSGCISVAKRRDISHLALIFFDFLPAIRAAVSRGAAMHRRKPRAIGRWPQGAAIISPCRTGIGSHCNGRPVG